MSVWSIWLKVPDAYLRTGVPTGKHAVPVFLSSVWCRQIELLCWRWAARKGSVSRCYKVCRCSEFIEGFVHTWFRVWNKMCWTSVHPFCCTRCQSLLAEMGTIALGCHTWSTMADLLLWMQMVSKPSRFRYCQELANSYSTKLVICSYQHNRLMVFAFSL